MSGTLYLLPTPISTTSPQVVLPATAIALAHRIGHFLVEDAKSARAFLKEVKHPTPLRDLSIVEIGHSPADADLATWLAPLRHNTDIALLSEAGCPAVADPGATLVAAAHRNRWPVRPLVGPSSIMLALMASGLDGQHFRFIGYLPVAAEERASAIRALESKAKSETQIFIETPYRNVALFDALLQYCRPTTRLAVAVDLTGDSEFVLQCTVEQWRAQASTAHSSLAKRPAVFCLLA